MVTYTKNDVAKMFKISRTTLYRHMEKNNMDKNMKLTDKEIAILKQSIRPTLTLDEGVINKEEHSKVIAECKEKYEQEIANCNERILKQEATINVMVEKNDILIEKISKLESSINKLDLIIDLIQGNNTENIKTDETLIFNDEDQIKTMDEETTLNLGEIIKEDLGEERVVEEIVVEETTTEEVPEEIVVEETVVEETTTEEVPEETVVEETTTEEVPEETVVEETTTEEVPEETVVEETTTEEVPEETVVEETTTQGKKKRWWKR